MWKLFRIFAHEFTNVKRRTKVVKINDISKKMNEILVKHGLKMQIHRVLGCSRPTINEALSGRSDTDYARKIRWYALRHGGVEIPSNNNQ